MGRIIEISKRDSLAGRASVKFILHEIFDNDTEFNKNGISWEQPYVEQNAHTVKGMPLVTQFLDDEKTIPFGGHGEINVVDGIITFKDSLVVGSFENAYIDEVEVNNKKINALIGEAYIYEQRFPHLVEYLRDEYENNRSVESSIEICKSSGNSQIVYATGYKPQGRIPETYDYSGHAILIGQQPSDDSALMIELNHFKENKIIIDGINSEVNEVNKDLKKDKILIKSKSFEINELSYDDIATIVSRAFNNIMAMKEPNEYYCYCIYRFYPVSGTVIFCSWDTPTEYYKTTYNITNNDVTIGDVTEVEMTWTPSNDEANVELNTSLIRDILQKNNSNKGGDKKVDETKIAEINAKLDDLTTKLTDSDSKIAELNSAIVEANKTIEVKTTELNSATEELNMLRVFKEEKDLEIKKAEVNTYFETEVKKNGFTETELNSLKTDYVDKMDLDGLKIKEAEFCVKKVKELNSIEKTIETNTDNNALFMSIQNTEKSDEDYSDLF
jgi:uncharacterized coiled-coil protein SlyX